MFWGILCVLALSQAQDYVRLSDERYSLHFPAFSTTDTRQIAGTDPRFACTTGSVDYTMMSWVQIQEQQTMSWIHMWRIKKGTAYNTYNRTPAVFMNIGNTVHGWVATSTNENFTMNVSTSGVFPMWMHVSVRAWGSSNTATTCVQEWGGSQSCTQRSITGTVDPFASTSTVEIGAHDQGSWPSAKMQILDLRYYTGSCMTDSDISTVINGASCNSQWSTGCWGPGNYSWNEFITLVDPHVGRTLDGSMTSGSGYVQWHGSDSFLMGRTYNSEDMASTGWYYEFINKGSYLSYFRLNNEDCECCSQHGCKVGTMMRINGNYHYWHDTLDCGSNTCMNKVFTNGSQVNRWRFVVGSTCAGTSTMYACYADDQTGGMSCTTKTNCSGPWATWSTSANWSYVGQGSKWHANPDMAIKDARYYYTQWLNTTEMSTIYTTLTCQQNCDVCSFPDTCTTCIDGYFGASCQPCQCPWATCSGSAVACTSWVPASILLNNDCVQDWGVGFWEDFANQVCEPCDSCCEDCTGSLGTECTLCQALCYMQPGNTGCAATCPANYYPDDPTRTCPDCHAYCETCSSAAVNDWSVCRATFALQPDNITCDTDCPASYWEDTTARLCKACNIACNTCTGPDADNCITCSVNYFLQPDLVTCILQDCPPHYYMNSPDWTCQPCDALWEECTGPANNVCSYCSAGNALQPSSTTCETDCPNDYWEDGGTVRQCKPCHSFCDIWFESTNTDCTECAVTYYLQPSPPIPPVTNATTCLFDSCPDGWWRNVATKTCDPCDVACELCHAGTNVDWDYCAVNYYEQPTSATTCLNSWPNDYYKDDTNRNCPACNYLCDLCDGPNWDDNWTLCGTGAYLQPSGTACLQVCPDNYWPDTANKNCALCDVKCTICSGPLNTECAECSTGNYLQPSPNETTWLPNCPDPGYYRDTLSLNCETWHVWCYSCTGPTNEECPDCNPGYTQQPATTICELPCPVGYFPDPSDSSCKVCHQYCKYCTALSQTTCSHCQPNYFLQPPPNDTTCDVDCGTGYWEDTIERECIACHAYCEDCTAAEYSSWINCSAGNYKQPTGTDCLPNWPSQYYGDNATGECESCDSKCEVCFGGLNSECSQCTAGNYMLDDGTTCDASCPANGFWADTTARRCQYCHSYCDTCTGSQYTQCSVCATGYFLQPSTTTCINTCPTQTYENVNVCTACHAACALCSGPGTTACYTCLAPYYKHQTQSSCILTCDDGFYPDNGSQTCLECHAYCSVCTDGTKHNWTSCNANSYLDGTTCDSSCPTTKFPNPVTNSCDPCHDTCLVCVAGQSTDWSNCIPYAEIQSDKSCQWATKMYPTYTPFTCNACHDVCLECTGGASNTCTSCEVNSSPQLGSCAWDPGFYTSYLPFTCNACHDEWATCSAGLSTDCLTCIDNTTLVAGSCVVDSGYYVTYLPFTAVACPRQCLTCTGPDRYTQWQSCANYTPDEPCCYQVGAACWDEICGDDQIINNEECDDGNTIINDGWGADCRIEQGGWDCNPICYPLWGDGYRVGSEICDDANNSSSDGCSNACLVEPGFQCIGGSFISRDHWFIVWGDGIWLGQEGCDDGNTVSEDGCSGDCLIEPYYACTNTHLSQSTCTCEQTLTDAYITYDKIQMKIVFASDVMAMSSEGEQLCIDLFPSTVRINFGAGHTCTLEGPSIIVQFGNTHTMTEDIDVIFHSGLVTTQNCKTHPWTSDKVIDITQSLDIPSGFNVSPDALIDGPESIYSCQGLKLNAYYTTGLQGRQAQYTWRITQTDPIVDPLVMVSYQQAYLTETVDIYFPASVLEAAPTVYVFELVVVNDWAFTDTDYHTVMVNGEQPDSPTVEIQGPDNLSIYFWQRVELRADARPNVCETSSQQANMQYEWTIANTAAAPIELDSAQGQGSRILELAENFFTTTGVYTVTVTSWVQFVDPRVTATDTIQIEVKEAAVLADVKGESAITIGIGQPLTLSAENSMDMNTRTNTGLSYEWSCSPPCPLGVLTNQSSLVLPKNTMIEGLVKIHLTVSSGSRQDSEEVQVTYTIEDKAQCEIHTTNTNFDRVLSASKPTKVKAVCYTRTPRRLNYAWSIPTLLTTDLIPNTADKRTIKIREDAMNYLETYTISLTVTDEFYGTSGASLTLSVNSPPLTGSLECAPVSGEAYKTVFELFAPSWVDEDLPLTYVFRIGDRLLSDRILDQQLRLLLPIGTQLHVDVYDSYDAQSSGYKDIVILQSEDEFETVSNYIFNNLPVASGEQIIAHTNSLTAYLAEYKQNDATVYSTDFLLQTVVNELIQIPMTASLSNLLIETIYYILATDPTDITQTTAELCYDQLSRIIDANFEMEETVSDQLIYILSWLGSVSISENTSTIVNYLKQETIRRRVADQGTIRSYSTKNIEYQCNIEYSPGQTYGIGTTNPDTFWNQIDAGESVFSSEIDNLFLLKFSEENVFVAKDSNEVLDDEVENELDPIGFAIVQYKNDLQDIYKAPGNPLSSDTYSVILFNEGGTEIEIQNLAQPIEMLFPLLDDLDVRSAECIFWQDVGWRGYGWEQMGEYRIGNTRYIKCDCDHLTNFAIRSRDFFVSEEEELLPEAETILEVANDEEEDDCNSYSLSTSPILYIAFGVFVLCHVAAALYACKDSKQSAQVKYDVNNTQIGTITNSLDTTMNQSSDLFAKPSKKVKKPKTKKKKEESKIYILMTRLYYPTWLFYRTKMIPRSVKFSSACSRLCGSLAVVYIIYYFGLILAADKCNSQDLGNYSVAIYALVGAVGGIICSITVVAHAFNSVMKNIAFIIPLCISAFLIFTQIYWAEEMSIDVVNYILITWALSILLDFLFLQVLFVLLAYVVYRNYDGKYERSMFPWQLYPVENVISPMHRSMKDAPSPKDEDQVKKKICVRTNKPRRARAKVLPETKKRIKKPTKESITVEEPVPMLRAASPTVSRSASKDQSTVSKQETTAPELRPESPMFSREASTVQMNEEEVKVPKKHVSRFQARKRRDVQNMMNFYK